ncbi:hypothetical protein O181_060900 [Austropuccinia psidii MF-1]|uniref:Integrase catalytic domain-containing protein n=1 Tax=Austropuccinia psidii MF-1 TaxID=1389203 RepID=A0A9Q3I005_9BASI|nr:hypothetical protein [Austropuccinia psidii MF-1]
MLQNIEKPVKDVKKQINPLEKDVKIQSRSKNPADLGRLSIWISKAPIFLLCHKDDTAMDSALHIRNRVVSWTGIFTNIISERGPKCTSALWTNLHQLFGIKLSFSTAYHPQTDGLAERMIQTLEDMVRRCWACGIELKHFDGFTHDWCTL